MERQDRLYRDKAEALHSHRRRGRERAREEESLNVLEDEDPDPNTGNEALTARGEEEVPGQPTVQHREA